MELNTLAIVQARINSTRYPGKVLEKVNGIPLIEILFKRLSKAKNINKMIKDKKLKVQSQIQGEQLRVTGKKIDDLQSLIQMLKDANLDINLQFVNMKN